MSSDRAFHTAWVWSLAAVAHFASHQVASAASSFQLEPFQELTVSSRYVSDVALGDLNGDGKLDLAVSVSDHTGGQLLVVLNRGNRMFDAPVSYPALLWIEDVALGDLNADGALDVVAAYGWYGPEQVSVFLGRGDGTFEARIDVESGGKTVRPHISDLNGDRAADVVLAAPQANGVMLLWGKGNGAFSSPSPLPAGDSPWDVEVAHLNADALPDLAVPCEGLNGVAILLARGGGRFAPPVTYFTGRLAYTAEAGDLNNDGATDLAVTSFDMHTVSVLRGHRNGRFGGKRDYTTHTRWDIGGDPDDVAIADLDGDGWRDLAAVNRLSSTVVVNMNRGDGTFALRQTYGCGPNPETIRLADLDQDGVPDAVLPNAVSSLSILYGSRAGATPAEE